jgi:DNA-binding FadR family transcriptional regulator
MYQRIMRELLEQIAAGTLAPKNRLPRESDLAEQFDVSRGVIRECVRGLEERGMITVRQGSGATVNDFETWNVLDPDVMVVLLNSRFAAGALFELVECRRVIEVAAAGLAAERAEGTNLGRLAAALSKMINAADLVDGSRSAEDEFHQADVEFHQAVLEACGNGALLQMVEPVQRTLIDARRSLARPEHRFERSIPEHKAILNAIASADAEAAREAMRTHLQTVENNLRAFAESQAEASLSDEAPIERADAHS